MKANTKNPELTDIAVPHTLRLATAVSIVACIMSLGLIPVHGGAIPGWGSDVDTAFAKAKASGSPLILVVAVTGCPACEYLAGEAVKTPAANALRDFVKVRAEATDHPDLHRTYASAGTPTIVVFTAEIGYDTPAYTYTGALRAADLVRLARSVQPQDIASVPSTDKSRPAAPGREKQPITIIQTVNQVPSTGNPEGTSLLASAEAAHSH